ncbi:MAG: hypothetical protein KK926_04125 [Methanomethylovorans sp.]|nr:hypothetical protein [Methanomethylovorans sp.]
MLALANLAPQLGLPEGLAGWEKMTQEFENGENFSSGQTTKIASISLGQLDAIVDNTIAVMTVVSEKRAEWRKTLTGILQKAQELEENQDIEFFTALLAILDGEPPTLPLESPYTDALDVVKAGIVAESPEENHTEMDHIQQLIEHVITAVHSNDPDASQIFDKLSEMVVDPQALAHYRELGKVLQQYMSGIKNPDLSNLPDEIAALVLNTLDKQKSD